MSSPDTTIADDEIVSDIELRHFYRQARDEVALLEMKLESAQRRLTAMHQEMVKRGLKT